MVQKLLESEVIRCTHFKKKNNKQKKKFDIKLGSHENSSFFRRFEVFYASHQSQMHGSVFIQFLLFLIRQIYPNAKGLPESKI